jgi:hypothetical protein
MFLYFMEKLVYEQLADMQCVVKLRHYLTQGIQIESLRENKDKNVFKLRQCKFSTDNGDNIILKPIFDFS